MLIAFNSAMVAFRFDAASGIFFGFCPAWAAFRPGIGNPLGA
jgi:hypothetical protein